MYKSNLIISDLSGIGKVALLPMISIASVAGLELSILPTTILSSHTGGFPNVYIDDYSDGMDAFLNQWMGLDMEFNSIITSYFKNPEQIERIKDFITSEQAKNAKLIVDPVMADNGKLYRGFTNEHVKSLRILCGRANLIIPNFSEANLLTASNYDEAKASEKEIMTLIKKLKSLGSKSVIISGIAQEKKIIIAYYDEKKDDYGLIHTDRIGDKFFGTGDMFTSVVASCFLQDVDLKSSIKLASEWINTCLKHSIELNNKENRNKIFGISYEKYLGELAQKINELKNNKEIYNER